MRVALAAVLATAAALTVASMLGIASAEAPTTTPQRTVSVEGVASAAIDPRASAATATAIYHQTMLEAVADGQAKAQLLAGKVGSGLGAAQSVVEGGGYITCSGGGEAGAEYEGAQPDFGSPGISIASARTQVGASKPLVGRPTVRHGTSRKRPAAKTAAASSCSLSTQVALVYPLS
jgi:hypothetical protein